MRVYSKHWGAGIQRCGAVPEKFRQINSLKFTDYDRMLRR